MSRESLSIEQLPYDANGGLVGKWLVQLRDEFNSHHAGVLWEKGRSVAPVTGQVLRRFVAASNNVVGALRVEGEPCALGDVSTLLEHAPPEAIPEELRTREKAPVTPALPSEPLIPSTGVIEPATAPLEAGPAAASVEPASAILPPAPEPPTAAEHAPLASKKKDKDRR